MKITFALDTNTISYLLWGEGGVGMRFRSEIMTKNNAYAIPHIVLYEVKRWLNDKPSKKVLGFTEVFDAFYEAVKKTAHMCPNTWLEAAEIYIKLKQRGLLIKDADILIAAYCIVNGYTLVTRNRRDFERIEGLSFVDWFA